MPLKMIEGGRDLEISISTHNLVTERRDLSRLFRSNAIIFPNAFPISFKISGLI